MVERYAVYASSGMYMQRKVAIMVLLDPRTGEQFPCPQETIPFHIAAFYQYMPLEGRVQINLPQRSSFQVVLNS
jgi:hypothetical protein